MAGMLGLGLRQSDGVSIVVFLEHQDQMYSRGTKSISVSVVSQILLCRRSVTHRHRFAKHGRERRGGENSVASIS